MHRFRRFLAFVIALAVVVRPSFASAEETPPPEPRGVPLMTAGAALFGTSYGLSLAIGVHATVDFIARCGGDGPRPLAEAIDCLSPPATMHLMVPIAGPFRALAETRDDSDGDKALLVVDGIAQVTGVVLAGIGMAQYIDGRAQRAAAAKTSLTVVPRGAGLQLVGTF